MLTRPSACSRAVQRHIRGPSEAVWITENSLSRAFERFCVVSRSSRRNGSSIPGPLESRRRLGRRRMTQVSEGSQSSLESFGTLWGMSEALDSTQWRWEPPSKRQRQATTKESTSPLPAWLRDFESSHIEEPFAASEHGEAHSIQQFNTRDLLRSFRASMRTSTASEAYTLCDTFYRDLNQRLVLGLVSEFDLCMCIHKVTRDLRRVLHDENIRASQQMLFYESIWDGMRNCKVLRPTDLGTTVLSKILFGLRQLPVTARRQNLVSIILEALAPGQAQLLKHAILSLDKAWSSHCTTSTTLMKSLMKVNTKESHIENFLATKQYSIALAKALGHISSDAAADSIRCSSNFVSTTIFNNMAGFEGTVRRLRGEWLSAVASLSCVKEELLIDFWVKLDSLSATSSNTNLSQISRMTLREGCEVLLEHWIAHSFVNSPSEVRSSFRENSRDSHNNPNAAIYLLKALGPDMTLRNEASASLFRVLRGIGKPGVIYIILKTLSEVGIKMDKTILTHEIYELCRVDPRRCLDLFRYSSKLQRPMIELRLDELPEVVTCLITNSDIHPHELFGILQIPLYTQKFDSRTNSLNNRSNHDSKARQKLSAERIILVHKMALAFSETTRLSHRVALRNVMQCILYLRSHGVPLSSDMSRILTRMVIQKDLSEKGWLGKQKLDWVLRNIEKAEGPAVLDKLDKTLHYYQSQVQRDRWRRNRESNPLGVGLIS